MNLDDHLDHFGYRLIRDAFNEATSAYWLRRAEQFEAARPRPGDYIGAGGDLAYRALDKRLADTAEACRRRAHEVKGLVA